jgi:polygalacturonase
MFALGHLYSFLVIMRLLLAEAAPQSQTCTGTIASLNDVAAAVKCTTININGFTVPAGQTFKLALASGTLVNLRTHFPTAFVLFGLTLV